jgi:DNA-binding HxlR family transcriptional regulator
METDDRECPESETASVRPTAPRAAGGEQKVATEQLRELEREGIISRTAFGNRWERVEYSLTGYGRTLVPVLTLMADWGMKHQRRRSRLGARAAENRTNQRQDDSQVEEPA